MAKEENNQKVLASIPAPLTRGPGNHRFRVGGFISTFIFSRGGGGGRESSGKQSHRFSDSQKWACRKWAW